jgi:hypothetical protein
VKYVYEGEGAVVAAGIRFEPGAEIEVNDKVAAKLEGREGFSKAGKAAKEAAATAAAAEQKDALADRRALVKRAKELGIPATGKSDELKAEIEKAEATAASAAAAKEAAKAEAGS